MLYPILRSRTSAPNVWEDMFNVRNEFDRLFDRWAGRDANGLAAWMPPVDVRETEDSLIVEAELPGLTTDDVDVRVENGVLTISGEKKHTVEEAKDEPNYHFFERRYGRFERSFTLPRSVDAEHVQAQFDNGILTVALPKTETAKPRRIQIQSGAGRGRLGSK